MDDGFDGTELGIGLDDLIRVVQQSDGPDEVGDPIERVSRAVLVGQRLGELGDHLIGHFVDQARASGASWQAIGAGMGVTKQAAQKRFVPGAGDVPQGGLLERFAPRARTAVVGARDVARRLGAAEVGVEHLLLAIVAEPEALATKALAAQGVTAAQIRDRITAKAGDTTGDTTSRGTGRPTGEEPPERIRYSAPARKVLEVAVREALRLGHNYVGTEHLLLAILRAGGSEAHEVLGALGVTRKATESWLRRELAELVAQKLGLTALPGRVTWPSSAGGGTRTPTSFDTGS